MLYFDTSFLVPLLFQESISTQIDAFIRWQRAGELTVSHWTRLEFSSVLAREVRMGQLDRNAALDAEARFDALVAESFAVILPSAADFELSRAYLQRYETKLRVGDAFHLAIAKNHAAAMIHSLDKGLLHAASLLGIPATKGIRTR